MPNVKRVKRVDTAIINGFGFGGQNAVAVFRRFDIERRSGTAVGFPRRSSAAPQCRMAAWMRRGPDSAVDAPRLSRPA